MSGSESAMDIAATIRGEDVTDLTKQLVRLPGHRDLKQGESAVADFLVSRFQSGGISVEARPVLKERRNVIATIEGSHDGPTLMFNGHMDTVPVYTWQSGKDPFTGNVEEGRVVGRGACDMKGGLAAMVVAMEAIKKSGVDFAGKLVFTGVVGEEGEGSVGAWEIIRNGPQADMVIVGEPTRLQVAVSHKGIYCYEIVVRGKTAHSGTPEKGVNAIMKMSDIIQALKGELIARLAEKRHPLLGPPTLTVAVIKGGLAYDVVPDECRILMNYRAVPPELPEDLCRNIGNLIKELNRNDPEIDARVLTVTRHFPWNYGTLELPAALPLETPPDHVLVRALRSSVIRVRGADAGIVGVPYWTDAAIFSNAAKTPSVVCGPGDGAFAHSPYEFVPEAELWEASRIYALTALQLCRQEKT